MSDTSVIPFCEGEPFRDKDASTDADGPSTDIENTSLFLSKLSSSVKYKFSNVKDGKITRYYNQ